jgi:hypothetical protein
MPEDGLPEKVGQYYAVDDLRIDPTKPGDTRMFRTEGWPLALIVSEDIKMALERGKVTPGGQEPGLVGTRAGSR